MLSIIHLPIILYGIVCQFDFVLCVRKSLGQMRELEKKGNPEIDMVGEDLETRDHGDCDPDSEQLENEGKSEVGKEEEEGVTWEEDECDLDSENPNENFLAELNLIIVMLSLFSLSSEDCPEDDHEKAIKSSQDDHKAKLKASRSLHSKREIYQGKFPGRLAGRFQTMVKDCRHGRKM